MAATLSKSWRVVRHHASCYTDANAKLDRSHSQQIIPPPPSLPFSPLIACWNNGNVSLLDLTTGHITHTLHSLSDDSFTTFAISPSHSLLATVASRSSLLTLHSLTPPHYATLSSIKTTPYHSQPITAVAFSPSSTLLATASLDRSLRLFHLPSLSLHLTLRGHSHPLHLLAFHPTLPHLLSSDTSGHLRLWDLSHPSGLCHPLPPHHLSPLTSLTHLTPSLLLTAALDNVLCLWSTTTLPYTLLRTIPVYEPVRAITPWPPSSPLPPGSSPLSKGGPGEVAVTGGEKGELKWWEVRTGRLLQTHAMPSVLDASSSTPSPAASKFIANQIASLFLLPCPPPPPSSSSSSPSPPSSSPPFHLVVVTMEQNFHLFSPTLTPGPLYIGHNDEILDLRFHPTTPHLIAATNSPQVRVFHTQQLHAAAILSGHVDVVMGVDVSGDGRWVVTASKDRTVRVWEGGGEWRCVGVCEGHAESVGCVAFSRGTAKPYIVSGARDRTVKMWDATPLLSLSPSSPSSSSPPTILSLPCLSTLAAHSKDINCIASSPNGRLIASGSEDRSISLCSSSPHSPLARLQGHRRGVWSVRFSPVEKVLASASGDKTVKVWSLVDWSCLKTLEGHVGSVKGVGWLRGGMQVMSGGDEGVVRLWTVKTSECVASWVVPTHEGGGEGEEGGEGDDEEEVGGDKVWALDVSADGKRMVTGGVGSVLNVWEDVTEVEEEAEREERVVVVGKEQRLMNAIKGKRWKEATAIALELKQPRRLHQVLAQVLKEMEGEGEVQRLLKGLADDAMDVLLTYVKDWNTNAKTATVANLVLSCLFRAVPLANLQKRKTLVDHIPGLVSAASTSPPRPMSNALPLLTAAAVLCCAMLRGVRVADAVL